MSSYMDDIKVKISEKYKPPAKISLPMTYSQRVKLNKQIEDNLPSYEFNLEKTVQEKMAEWRTARKSLVDQRNERLSQSRDEFNKKRHKTEPLDDREPPVNESSNILIPTQSYSDILTPVPLNATEPLQLPDKSPFNISDFEDDTSSPFDNVEMKSINDMAELAQVLQTNNKQAYSWTTPYTFPAQNSLPSASYDYYYAQQPSIPHVYSAYDNVAKSAVQSDAARDIVKALQTELDNTHLDNTVLNDKPVENHAKNENPFDSLTKEMQEMCVSISSMGFPIDRVARTCKILGNDQKKVR